MKLQPVFRGLADSTRRDILRLLASRNMTIAEVAEHFDITRAAVKKHLQILEEGGLIAVHTDGRTRVNRLQPDALKRADDWMKLFSVFWSARLNALDDALRADMEGQKDMSDVLTKTVFFSAAPEMVWAYLTDKDKLGTWYHPARASLEEGQNYELYEAGKGTESAAHVWGHVIRAEPPKELVCTFVIGPFGEKETTLYWVLESLAGGTKLTLRHEGISAASGDAVARLLGALDRGWDTHFGALRDAAQTEAA